MKSHPVLRVGCASGFWGDSAIALPQLLADARLDYIVFDYLAEITMSLLARARAKSQELGYATDFVGGLSQNLTALRQGGVKIIANAGGVNPHACAAAIRKMLAAAECELSVAVVAGDDLVKRADEFNTAPEMFSGAPMPEQLLSLNAYLGAQPIAAALAAGADIVVTGRCVDSALVLGPCLHEFGWATDDFDRLSAGSLAGHILECGAQGTGGIFTDWREADDWSDIGYPIAEITTDGTFTITKVAGTGGVVRRAAVAEQLLYEIGDPATYLLPDVTCDWTDVRIEQIDDQHVRLSNAKGRQPTAFYKASATFEDGFRVGVTWTIIGEEAVEKAEKVADAVLRRCARMLESAGLAGFSEVDVEIVGSEASYGANSRARHAREVVLKIAAKHSMPAALNMLVREFTSAGTSMAPGFTGMGGNRPKVMPVVRLFSLLVSKDDVPVTVQVDDSAIPFTPIRSESSDSTTVCPARDRADLATGADFVDVPLIRLAWGRSGDKGNNANIGIIARCRDYLPFLRAVLTTEAVADTFSHYHPSRVERFDLPGIDALNFVLHDVLGGGGIASLRNDPQAKGYAQILLGRLVAVPLEIADRCCA